MNITGDVSQNEGVRSPGSKPQQQPPPTIAGLSVRLMQNMHLGLSVCQTVQRPFQKITGAILGVFETIWKIS